MKTLKAITLALLLAAVIILLLCESDSSATLLATKAAAMPLGLILARLWRKWNANEWLDKLTRY